MDLPTLTRAVSEAIDDIERIVVVSVTKEIPRSQSLQETIKLFVSVIGKEHIEDLEVMFDNVYIVVTMRPGHEHSVDSISQFYHRNWLYTFYHPHPIPGRVEGVLRGIPRFFSSVNLEMITSPLSAVRLGFTDITTEYLPVEGTDFMGSEIKIRATIPDLAFPRDNFGLLFHTIRAGPFRGDVKFKVVETLYKVEPNWKMPAEEGFEVDIIGWMPNTTFSNL